MSRTEKHPISPRPAQSFSPALLPLCHQNNTNYACTFSNLNNALAYIALRSSSDEGVCGGSIPIPLLGPATIGTVSTRPACCRGQSRQPQRPTPEPRARSSERAPEAHEQHEPSTEKQPERDSKSSEGPPGSSSKEKTCDSSLWGLGTGPGARGGQRGMLAQTLPHGKDTHCFLKVFIGGGSMTPLFT